MLQDAGNDNQCDGARGGAERQQGGAAPAIDPAAETACTAR